MICEFIRCCLQFKLRYVDLKPAESSRFGEEGSCVVRRLKLISIVLEFGCSVPSRLIGKTVDAPRAVISGSKVLRCLRKIGVLPVVDNKRTVDVSHSKNV